MTNIIRIQNNRIIYADHYRKWNLNEPFILIHFNLNHIHFNGMFKSDNNIKYQTYAIIIIIIITYNIGIGNSIREWIS